MAARNYRDILPDLLARRLVRRDGFILGRDRGNLVIEKLRRRNVCVVMKDSAVTKEEVESFEHDMWLTTGHGIMCTREGKVAHRSFVDFRRVSTDRYAVYLVNVGDDADTVVMFLKVLYGFDNRRREHGSLELQKNEIVLIKSICKKERETLLERTYSGQRNGPVRSQVDPTKTGCTAPRLDGTNLKM